MNFKTKLLAGSAITTPATPTKLGISEEAQAEIHDAAKELELTTRLSYEEARMQLLTQLGAQGET